MQINRNYLQNSFMPFGGLRGWKLRLSIFKIMAMDIWTGLMTTYITPMSVAFWYYLQIQYVWQCAPWFPLYRQRVCKYSKNIWAPVGIVFINLQGWIYFHWCRKVVQIGNFLIPGLFSLKFTFFSFLWPKFCSFTLDTLLQGCPNFFEWWPD